MPTSLGIILEHYLAFPGRKTMPKPVILQNFHISLLELQENCKISPTKQCLNLPKNCKICPVDFLTFLFAASALNSSEETTT